MRKLLLVANVAKEHVIKFHIPTIRKLSERGWIVDVACAGEEQVPCCRNQYQLPYERASINGKLIRGIRQLRGIIDAEDYDVIYCHTTIGGVAGRIAGRRARKNGAKVVYLSHGYYFHRGCPFYYWPTFYLMEKLMARLTDVIITINKEDEALARKRFSRCKIYRIDGIGVDTSRLHVSHDPALRAQYRAELGIPAEAKVLIYLAELHRNKNQELLLRVTKALREQGLDAYLALAGYDHAEGAYQALAGTMGLSPYVRFLGWRDDIGELYGMADVCTASSLREGFGLNLVEAMACGLPVVATNNRGHASILTDGENGFLVDPEDEDRFAACVERVLTDESLRARLIAAGEQTRDRYSSETITEILCEILEQTAPSE